MSGPFEAGGAFDTAWSAIRPLFEDEREAVLEALYDSIGDSGPASTGLRDLTASLNERAGLLALTIADRDRLKDRLEALAAGARGLLTLDLDLSGIGAEADVEALEAFLGEVALGEAGRLDQLPRLAKGGRA